MKANIFVLLFVISLITLSFISIPRVNASGPLTLVQDKANTVSGNSISLAFTNNVASNNLLVVIAEEYGTSGGCTFNTPTDTIGNTWTQITSISSSTPLCETAYYAVNKASGSDTVTISFSGISAPITTAGIFEYANALTTFSFFNTWFDSATYHGTCGNLQTGCTLPLAGTGNDIISIGGIATSGTFTISFTGNNLWTGCVSCSYSVIIGQGQGTYSANVNNPQYAIEAIIIDGSSSAITNTVTQTVTAIVAPNPSNLLYYWFGLLVLCIPPAILVGATRHFRPDGDIETPLMIGLFIGAILALLINVIISGIAFAIIAIFAVWLWKKK